MSDDDDDFGPALPITLLARKRPRDDDEGEAKNAPFPDATDHTATITTADSVILRSQQVALPTAVPPPLSPTMLSQKQEPDHHTAAAAGTPPTAPTTTTPIQSSKATAGSSSSVWNVPLFDDIYGECYERSYRHENQNSSHDNWITSVAVVQASGGSGTHSRHFVATLDAAGTLRWWVKTPRGFFYVRSLSLWPSTSPSSSATETEETASRRRENDGASSSSSSLCGSSGLLLSTSEDPTLLLVCRNVKHLFHGAVSPAPSSSEDSVVELLQISTDLLIPDNTWKVPLLRSSSQATTTTATSSPRDEAPAMLICRGAHADTLLWFVAHPMERTISVCALRDDNTTNGRSRLVRWITVPTGTAHPLRFLAFSPPTATTTSVTASTQHKRLCFLCDEKGLIDYAAVNVKGIEEELLLDSQEEGSSPRGSLEPLWAVIPGRAAVAMTKPAPWWTSRVSFPKRPSTDFFVCLRRQLQPLALCPSLDGSQLLLVAASTAKHENEKGDMRTASATKNYHCFVLDVPTGKLITEFSAVSARGAVIASLRPVPLVAVPAQTPTPSALSTSAACAWLLPDMLDPNDDLEEQRGCRQPKRSVALRQHAASVVLTEKGSSSSGSSSATGAATFLKTLYGGELPPLDPSCSLSFPSPAAGAVVWDLFPAASVEPSQELKNFVTKSMFGQALSPAELSGIFAVGALRGALKSSSSSSSSASYDPYVLSVLNDRLLMFSSHPPSGVAKSGGAAPKRDFSCRAIEALCGGLTGGPNSHLLLQMDDAGHSPSSLLRENAKTNVSSLQNPLDDALDAVLVFQPHPNVAFNVQGVPYGPLLVRLKLFPHLAPLAVRNFFLLSNEDHFYDGLTFHRVIRGFMLQGGCPNGDGMGGKSRIPVVWNLSEPPSSSSFSSSTDVVSSTTEGWTRRLPPIVCSNNNNNDDESAKKKKMEGGSDEGQMRNEISDDHNNHKEENEGEMMSLSFSSSSLTCGPFRDEFATKAQMQDPVLGPLLRPVVNMTDSFLLCMANCGPDMNESQFFITVAPTPYLSHKHTVLGRVWLESEEEEQSRAHFLLQQQQQQEAAAALIHAEEGVLDRPANEEEGTKVVEMEEKNKEEKQQRDPFELFPPSHWRSNKKVHTLSSRQVLQKLSEVPVDAEDRPRRKIEIASLRVLPRSEV